MTTKIRNPKIQLVSFCVDWLHKFTLIVSVRHISDARPDANNVLRSTFDRCARIQGEGVVVTKLPEGAEQVKNCDWAWIVY